MTIMEIPPLDLSKAQHVSIREARQLPSLQHGPEGSLRLVAVPHLSARPAYKWFNIELLSVAYDLSPMPEAALNAKLSFRDKVHNFLLGASEITNLSGPSARKRTEKEIAAASERAYARLEAAAERRIRG